VFGKAEEVKPHIPEGIGRGGGFAKPALSKRIVDMEDYSR
jgi:hypothetical protein